MIETRLECGLIPGWQFQDAGSGSAFFRHMACIIVNSEEFDISLCAFLKAPVAPF